MWCTLLVMPQWVKQEISTKKILNCIWMKRENCENRIYKNICLYAHTLLHAYIIQHILLWWFCTWHSLTIIILSLIPVFWISDNVEISNPPENFPDSPENIKWKMKVLSLPPLKNLLYENTISASLALFHNQTNLTSYNNSFNIIVTTSFFKFFLECLENWNKTLSGWVISIIRSQVIFWE